MELNAPSTNLKLTPNWANRQVHQKSHLPFRETVTGWNCMRFKKDASEILYLEWHNPKHLYSLGSGYVIHLESRVLNTF